MWHVRDVVVAGVAAIAVAVPGFVVCSGCEKESASQSRVTPRAGEGDHDHPAGDDHDHAHDHDHENDQDHGHADGHVHGESKALGQQSAGGFVLTAVREGEVKAGGEASFNISVEGAAKPAAVRIWVGTEDSKGSVKARAEVESAGWHAHAEVPSQMPEGSRLWVEIESATGERHVVSFDLGV